MNGIELVIAAELVAARALVMDLRTKQGDGTGKLSRFMADFGVIPCFGEAGHGVH
jgi:hypothetical protein